MYKERYGKENLNDYELLGDWYSAYAIFVNTIPFIITMVLPEIATVLGLMGSVLGLFVLYIVPVMTYLKKLDIEKSDENAETPVNAEEIEGNEENKVESGPNDDFHNESQTKNSFYFKHCVIGTTVIAYGVAIFIISIYNPFKWWD